MDRTVTVLPQIITKKNDQGHNTSIFIYIMIKLLLHTLSPIEYRDLLLPRYGNIPRDLGSNKSRYSMGACAIIIYYCFLFLLDNCILFFSICQFITHLKR